MAGGVKSVVAGLGFCGLLLASAGAAQQGPQWNLSDAYGESSARSHCTGLFPDDLSTRAYCVRQGREGFQEFYQMVERYRSNAEITGGLAHCYRLFTRGGATDFATAAYCGQQQIDAWQELNR